MSSSSTKHFLTFKNYVISLFLHAHNYPEIELCSARQQVYYYNALICIYIRQRGKMEAKLRQCIMGIIVINATHDFIIRSQAEAVSVSLRVYIVYMINQMGHYASLRQMKGMVAILY